LPRSPRAAARRQGLLRPARNDFTDARAGPHAAVRADGPIRA
jgi:hypothetical protein